MKKVLKTLGKIISGMLLVLVLAAAGFVVLRPKPPKPPETATNIADVEAYLNELVAFGAPPGLSLIIVKNGEIVYSKAFGLADGPNDVPAAPEIVYKWWSMTKIFTAVAILQLHEQGLLDIDNPVKDYLPFFEVQYPSETSEIITIRHVLNHSSGIPDNVPEVVGWMHLEHEPRLDQTAFLKHVFPDYARLDFEPGTQAVYTNVGYMVLGAIIEAVSGQTYEEYVVEHILQPLRMEHTNFIYTDKMLPYAAVGSHPVISFESLFLPFFYYGRLGAFIREFEDGKMWFNRFYADSDPPTGLIGPATDLARFVIAYLNDGELEGKRILSPDTVSMMTHESHIVSVDTGQTDAPIQGLGWEIIQEEKRLCLQHGGGGPGFGSTMRLYPEESLGLMVIANDTTYDSKEILQLAASLEWE